jgi:hypothetical protein
MGDLNPHATPGQMQGWSVDLGMGIFHEIGRRQTACRSNFYAPVLNENDT